MPDPDSSAVSKALPPLEFYRPVERPVPATDLRMKMRRRGPSGLSATDLVALILGGRSAERRAQVLVRRFGLGRLRVSDPAGVLKERDINPAGALRLVAALELHRRFRSEENASRPRLTKSREVYDQVKDIANLRKEHLVGLYIDAQSGLIHRETLSVGSLNTTRTHPREILHPALVHLALGFILVHNHPSGGLDPSPEDLEFTRSVQRAGELMGIELYDHVIVAASGFVSMREMEML